MQILAKIGRVLAKIALTMLCVLPSVFIKWYCDDHGVILGGIPYMIICMPIMYAIIRIWSKPKKKEIDAHDQPEAVTADKPEEPVKEEMKIEKPIPAKMHKPSLKKRDVLIMLIAMSVVCVACITLTVITSVKLSDMNKAMVEMQNEMQVQYEQIHENKTDISHLEIDVQINEDDIRNHINDFCDLDRQVSDLGMVVDSHHEIILKYVF